MSPKAKVKPPIMPESPPISEDLYYRLLTCIADNRADYQKLFEDYRKIILGLDLRIVTLEATVRELVLELELFKIGDMK